MQQQEEEQLKDEEEKKEKEEEEEMYADFDEEVMDRQEEALVERAAETACARLGAMLGTMCARMTAIEEKMEAMDEKLEKLELHAAFASMD